MTNSKFIAALLKLQACWTATREIADGTQSLEDFWLDTDRADWMLWLLVRVGLWDRVFNLVGDQLSNCPHFENTEVFLLRRLDQNFRWNAANESAAFFDEDEECIEDYDPNVFVERMRDLVTWDEIEAAIHTTLKKEAL